MSNFKNLMERLPKKLIIVVIAFSVFIQFLPLVTKAQCKLLCNSDFENEQFMTSPSFVLISNSQMSCWKTTASDGKIEVWYNGFLGVPSYSGNQFIELNANMVSTLYQDFIVAPGTNLSINFAHRGRNGVDSMNVLIGPVGGPYVVVGKYGDGKVAWGYYTTNYTIPTGMGNLFSLRFESIYAAGGMSMGNFLDAISISPQNPVLSPSSTNSSCYNSQDGTASVSASGGAAPYTYSWSPSVGTTPSISGLSTGTYTVYVTEANGCSTSTNVTITEPAAILPSITGTTTICTGSNTTLAASGGSTYSWSTSATTTAITVNPTSNTTYTVTAENVGCTGTTTVSVTVTPLPTISINSDVTINPGDSTLLTTTGGGTYLWFPATKLSVTTDSTTVASPDSTTAYCVAVSNLGCTDTACVTVFVIENSCTDSLFIVPNVFTPNGDGINDTFLFDYTTSCFSDFSFVIFNRWGTELFSSTKGNFAWDGKTPSGSDASEGTYCYIIRLINNRNEEIIRKGFLQLIR